MPVQAQNDPVRFHSDALVPKLRPANVLFTVTGKEKALALKGVLEGPHEPEQLPSQLLQPIDGNLLWLVDKTAGSMLTTGIRE